MQKTPAGTWILIILDLKRIETFFFVDELIMEWLMKGIMRGTEMTLEQ